ncbi:MAG: filamentous hemagglutinin N-terminal domain-containing protein [Succinivibrio sp.]|nr:filamentous hemagglutinin N-terminal domain-containing protein [Succinivibrio sp.]
MNKIIKNLTLIIGLNLGAAYASDVLPSGAKNIAGDASIFKDDKSMAIISSKDRNVISWNDFSVGSENKVVFDEHKYLNLVHGSKASVIDGSIKFSGSTDSAFYLINPNGITLGKTGVIDANKIVLSTSKISEKTVKDFIDSGELSLSHKGMGKIKLIGQVRTSNLIVDGSQVIIRDIENIKRLDDGSYKEALTNTDGENIVIKSSTKRIDIGGRSGVDLESDYKLKKEDGLVDHTGEIALSDKEDFLKIKDSPDEKYFVTNDVDLGEIKETLDADKGFSGSLDGAFNSVSYTLVTDKGQRTDYGLFSKLDGASVSNLKLDKASVSVNSTASEVYAGALSGRVKDSTIRNVEVRNFDIHNEYNSPVTIFTGALAGAVEKGFGKSEISNVYTEFSDKTKERFDSYDYYVKGSLAGLNEDSLKLSGYIGTDSSDYSIFGENRSSKNYAEVITKPDSMYIKHGNGYSHTGFYAPFFVDDDIEITYNKEEPQSYEYTDFTDNPYFVNTNYVDVAYDYDTPIEETGVYTHTYSSKADGTQFYFVKNDKAADSADHYVKVIDRTIIIPPHNEETDNSHMPRNGSLTDTEYSLFNSYLYGDDKYRDEDYDHKSYSASLSFYNRIKHSKERISGRLLASLDLNSAPSGGSRTYAYNNQSKKKTS